MSTPTFTTNGHTNGTTHGGSSTDEAIDSLYAWMPPLQAPQPCPEASFSLTLKGSLDGIEALFTVRGQTASEFQANLAAVRGLLDAPTAAPTVQGEHWCAQHQVAMQLNQKDGRSWWSHKTAEGWCKGK